MFRDLLAHEFAPYGELTSSELDLLEAHYQLLTAWNERINLTRIRALEDVVRLHYCESLFLAKLLPAGNLRIVDVGSGAGFPGIPIAILRPDCAITLVESHKRKAVFLRETSRALPHVRVLASRAEAVTEQFDWLVSRAVAPEEIVTYGLTQNLAVLMASPDVAGLGEGWAVRKIPWGSNRVVAFHVKQ